MNKLKLIYGLMILTSFLLFSCSQNNPKESIHCVSIGDQVWMSKNLDVDTFRNGDLIPEARNEKEWLAYGKARKAAWCFYKNDSSNGAEYGKLYNWFAVNDPRGLAPGGWHVASDAEWSELADFSGGAETAGTALKSKSFWDYNGNGTNKSGFNGLPGGIRDCSGCFVGFGSRGFWWTSTGSLNSTAQFWSLGYERGKLYNFNTWISCLNNGFSVRCIMD